MQPTFSSVSWLDQLNTIFVPHVGVPIESVLPLIILLFLYVGLELVNHIEREGDQGN